MRLAQGWKDYELLDCSSGQRLERWGTYILIRPDPVVVWKGERSSEYWDKPDAVYHRSDSGGGYWEKRKKLPEEWVINWDSYVDMKVSPTGFKHTGVFPEQAANWTLYRQLLEQQKHRDIRVLNLFAYTGAATAVCLKAGALVCHVDASRGMTGLAKKNNMINALDGERVRYIVDDCSKFAHRELRRQHVYDAIILDPPSYGRGPSGELWKFEDQIYDLLVLCRQLLSSNPLFLSLNSYTAGLSAGVMRYLADSVFAGIFSHTDCDEVGIPVSAGGGVLSCGVNTLLYNSVTSD